MFDDDLFNIPFRSRPLPQTVWSKDGKEIQFNDRITQEKYGKSLLIKMVDFEDKGTYSCYVSNGVGDAQTFSISLTVVGMYFCVIALKIAYQ